MLNETFFLDGIDARDVGIRLDRPIEFSEAVPVVEIESIPGRNGDLVFETGSYENRTAKAKCFCLQKDVEKSLGSAGRFLMSKMGYRRLETSDDPDHFWLARVENSPQIEMRARTLAPFDIDFDCKPQRFLKSGENDISISKSGTYLYNNYVGTALPLIVVYGTGPAILETPNSVISIKEIGGVLYLDSETQNAYNNAGNQNANINAYSFPTFPTGEIEISFSSGIKRLRIQPRWWEL